MSDGPIQFEKRYLEYIQHRGGGSKDQAASSPESYVTYLRSVSRLLGQTISPLLLRSELDVARIARKLESKRAPATIRNYCSAMRQYVAMVQELRL